MKHPTLSGIDPVIRPQPTCGARNPDAYHLFRCDLPAGHLPREEHAETTRWRSEPERPKPGERPLR